MKQTIYASHPHPALVQLHNNACFWIGHMHADPNDHLGGQTFECPADGELDSIQVYSAAVQRPGKVILTVHAFDKETKNWGPVLSSSELDVDGKNSEKWICFQLPAVVLHKNNNYGFRLKSTDALMAIGEAAWPNKSPFAYGEEWTGSSIDRLGHYFRYFSLAFKVGLRA
jgi:hypothetical protein